MYRIQTKGYEMKEKLIIARKHLLPKIREQVNFTEEEVIIPDETIQHIVSSRVLHKKKMVFVILNDVLKLFILNSIFSVLSKMTTIYSKTIFKSK